MSLGNKLQSIPKWAIYAILIIATSIPLFFTIPVPNKAQEGQIDFYRALMAIPKGSTVLLGTDWTQSTHGESGGEFNALLRILMRREIKFVIYSTGDPQAPQVAIDTIRDMNAERALTKERPYKRFEDWLSVGYFPNSEGENQSIAADVRKAFAGRTDIVEGSAQTRDVWTSPVLKDIHSLKDIPMLILVTASSTSEITVERLNGKVPLAYMVTGVMVPQVNNYYASKQLVGMVGGLKGVYDIEYLMKYGINHKGDDGKIKIPTTQFTDDVPPLPGNSADIGAAYFPTLHVALLLMIIMVVIGNVGMFLSRKEKGNS